MSTKKIKRLVEKISSLQQTHEIDGTLSSIEKDLMLSYIRDLYDLYAFEKGSSKKTVKAEVPDVVKVEKSLKPKAKEEKKVAEPIKEIVLEEIPKEKEIPVSKPTPEPAPEPAPKPIPEPVKVEAVQPKVVFSDAMQSLFNEDSVVDLSDKLAQAPIKDLSKAMGLNERIFTVQELFGGDQDLFKSTIDDLNGLKDFKEASEYLAGGVATDLKWDMDAKVKKASHFVKLVRRRYL